MPPPEKSQNLPRWAIALAVVAGIALIAALAYQPIREIIRARQSLVLELRLDRPLASDANPNLFELVRGQTPRTLRGVLDSLRKAEDDDRVRALIAYVGAEAYGMATTQELRDAIQSFRASGKLAVVYADAFGEMGPGTRAYYLASAFDEVWLQPTGGLGLTGLLGTGQFLTGTLEKLDVKAQGDHRREYKTALNLFTEKAFTPPHREAVEGILESLQTQVVQGIAKGRGLSEAEVRTLIGEGPFIAPEAKDHGLVDHLGYYDEMLRSVRERAGSRTKLLYAERYLERGRRPYTKGEDIALIYGEGAVERGPSADAPFGGPATLGSNTVAGAFRAAVADDDIRAIIFRVDSPGGSAVASDTIWREVTRAREAQKPVIVSMGDVAASGGYYVACGATKIVAEPATITGSIGVVGVHLNGRGLWNRLGLSFDSVVTATNATMWSGIHDRNRATEARFQTWLDWVYRDFKQRVAEGRKLSAERVEEVARGRVWTGAQALELGLVDALGGLHEAVELAKQEANIDEDDDVELRIFPQAGDVWAQLFAEGEESSEGPAAVSGWSESSELGALRAIVKRAQALGLGGQPPGILTMPPLEIK